MLGELNAIEIEQLISSQYVGRIGCHADNVTYVVPISYAYDGTYIYAHTYEGMKIDIIRKNPNVCFEVENTKNLSYWQSAITWGQVEELSDGPEREEALKKLEARELPMINSETMHLNRLWPFYSGNVDDHIEGIILRIRLEKKTGRFEKPGAKYFFAT